METQQIKDVLSALLSFHEAYDRAVQDDGKLSIADVAFLVEPLTKLPAAVSGASEALEQLKDLDDAEKKDVMDFIKADYDISDDKLESVVESGMDAALSVAKFVALLKAEPAPVE